MSKFTCRIYLFRRTFVTVLMLSFAAAGAQNLDVNALRKSVRTTDVDTNLVNHLNNLAAYYHEVNPDSSLYYADTARKLAVKLGYAEGEANGYGNMAIGYSIRGDLTHALENYYASIRIYEKTGNLYRLALARMNAGIIYKQLQNFQKAAELYAAVLELNKTLHNSMLEANVSTNLGVLYQEQSVPEKDTARRAELERLTIEYYSRALKLYEQFGDKGKTGVVEGNLANTLFGMASRLPRGPRRTALADRALEYNLSSLGHKEAVGDQIGIEITLGNIGFLFLSEGKYAQASQYLQKALNLSLQLNDLEGCEENHQHLAELYEQTGQHKLAYDHYRQYITYRDSLSNEEATKKQTRLELQYEFDKKQTADSIRVAEEKKVAAAELVTEKNKKYSLYGGLALVLVFATFMYNRFRITNRQKKIIEQQKVLVEEQKKEVEEKQKEILDSIYYARRIQRSLIPTEKQVQKLLASRSMQKK